MSMEDIIRAWKADEETLEPHMPASPVGQELSEQELLDVVGGCTATCGTGGTCGNTCAGPTCKLTRLTQ